MSWTAGLDAESERAGPELFGVKGRDTDSNRSSCSLT